MKAIYVVIAVAIFATTVIVLYTRKDKVKKFLEEPKTKAFIKGFCVQAEQIIKGEKKGTDRLIYVCNELYKYMPDKLKPLTSPQQLAETVDRIFKEIAKEINGHKVAVPQTK